MEFNVASIQEMPNKIKRILLDDTAFYALLLVLVALSAYGLGKHTSQSVAPEMAVSNVVLLEPAPNSEPVTPPETLSTAQMSIVASKNGSKYHYLWCPGAKQINEENKVFFASETEAAAQGYTLAANCDAQPN